MSLEERQVRLEKLQRLQALGILPYAVDPKRTTTCAETIESFDVWMQEARSLTLAGRLLTIRVHGGMMFADLVDDSGKIQITFKEDEIGTEEYARFRDLMDPGDVVEATGTLFLTRRGEKSLAVTSWRPLAKALLPLPEKWHGLQDVETRYRSRELDLLTNPEARERFLVRSRLVSSLRRFLDAARFLEVETPMLHPIPGGANARPFVTHHHALDADFYLRIAPELYLKRLIVGGFERVYEIGRCFRNEGIDHSHNPEFTMLELYWAYAEREPFMHFLETMIRTMVQEAVGSACVMLPDGELSFQEPFPRKTFREAILEATGIDVDNYPTKESLETVVVTKGLRIDLSGCHGMGECLDELYKKTARPMIVQPTWIMDYPAELKPLANVSPEDPTKSACAQLVVCGAEVVNAYYHELHDPLLQRERLEEQEGLAAAGSHEAQRLDEPFLEALEHGMPPTSGVGIGIDRFVSLITGAGVLKEVILFPTLRPLTRE